MYHVILPKDTLARMKNFHSERTPGVSTNRMYVDPIALALELSRFQRRVMCCGFHSYTNKICGAMLCVSSSVEHAPVEHARFVK